MAALDNAVDPTQRRMAELEFQNQRWRALLQHLQNLHFVFPSRRVPPEPPRPSPLPLHSRVPPAFSLYFPLSPVTFFHLLTGDPVRTTLVCAPNTSALARRASRPFSFRVSFLFMTSIIPDQSLF